jgi:hypothetical protein
MNRHERRKATKVGVVKSMSVEELKLLPCCCAWDGCEKVYHGEMPHGWSALLLFATSPRLEDFESGRNMIRDTSLCPEHTEELNGLLKYIGHPEMSAPVAGSA